MQVAQYANHPPHSNHRKPRKMLRRFGSTLEIATPADALAAARESPQMPMRRPRADAAAATMGTPSPSSPADHALPSVQVLEDAVRKELASLNGQEELFLRSTSDLSCLLRDLSHEHGRSYFRYVLRDVFGDKSAIYTAPSSATDVLTYAQSVLRRLARAIHFAPLVLRASTQYVLREFQRAFPHSKSAERIVVGGVLFLRILCPALVKPEAFGFAPHSAASLPSAVQIAKLLQTTLKGQLAPSNQPEILTVNNFVATYHPFVETFLARFPQLTSSVANQLQRPAPVTRFASWDALDTSRSTPELPASCRGHDQEDETTRFRGMSLTTPEDLSQRKKKFSLRFW